MTDSLSVILVEDEALTVTISEDNLLVTITEDALVINITEVIDVGAGTSDHDNLNNLDTADQHPITVVTGLTAALAGKEAVGIAAGLIAAHAVEADPHTVYVLESALDALVTVIIANDAVVALNTAKLTNVPTSLEVGTVNATTVSITSDGGADDVTIPAATNTTAGVATAAQITKLEGIPADASDDQTASEVPIVDSVDLYAATDVEAALAENRPLINTNTAHASADGSSHTFIDQDVRTTAKPTLAGVELTPTDTPASDAGEVRYGDTDPSLYVSDGTTELDIVFGTPIKVVNGNGTAITKGQVVNITGVDTDLPEVVLAIATVSGFIPGIVVSTSISDGSLGYVLAMGMVHGLNTQALVEGDIVYLSGGVAGGLTTTKPDLPYRLIRIGICTYSHISLGKIYVHPQSESDELYDLRMVQDDRQEPQGFIRQSPTTMGDISFVEGTRTFSITPQGGETEFIVY